MSDYHCLFNFCSTIIASLLTILGMSLVEDATSIVETLDLSDYHCIGFLRGAQYAIALGLLDEGKVVLGVLACPNLRHDKLSSDSQAGCLFYAKVGAGTYMESLDGSALVKVHVSDIENPEEASFFESFEAAYFLHDLSSSIAKELGVKAPPVRIDSQAKYGALSRGDGAIYLQIPHKGYREKIWDHAAGCIVVTGKQNLQGIAKG